jgi:hypothetical protein
MTKETRDKLAKKYRRLVYDKLEEVDPDSTEDWFSMAIGFGLGCGLSPKDADNFAKHVTYTDG